MAVVLFHLEPIFLSPFPLRHVGMWVFVPAACCLYKGNRAVRTRSCSISEEEKKAVRVPSIMVSSIYSTVSAAGEVKKLLSNCRQHRN